MPDGGELAITGTVVRGAVEVVVTDTGTGIEPGMASRLFDPFFTTKTTGTGLGLAIVQRIVHAQGGSIGIDTASPRGTAVVVRLPAARAAV